MQGTARAKPYRARLAGMRSGIVPGVAACIMLAPIPASADKPEVRITPNNDLRFGTFMVFGNGSRTVSALGNVTDISLVALEGNPTGPARFTISYDRGNQSRNVLDIEMEVVITPPATVRQQGVQATLSAFETDLPGVRQLSPGQPIRLTLDNCRDRVCSVSFSVGGRLDVSRQFGGASLTIPIPVDATVISIDRQGR